MELPHLGVHCSEPTCKKLDFLPVKCDGCNKVFCNEHYNYSAHNCPSAYKKDVQVPVCPLCNKPIPVTRGQLPDIAVGAHIDSDCQSDPAKSRRKVFTNKCSMKGCKQKEIVRVVCNECKLNYCLKHRHPTDHKCEGQATVMRRNAEKASTSRQNQQNGISSISALQGSLDEDEALARAMSLSMETATNKKQMTQEELDEELARQLQQQEHSNVQGGRPRSNQNRNDRCIIS